MTNSVRNRLGLLRSTSPRELPNKLITDNCVAQTILKAINTCSTIYTISQWLITINIFVPDPTSILLTTSEPHLKS